jgi:hypothetical protein
MSEHFRVFQDFAGKAGDRVSCAAARVHDELKGPPLGRFIESAAGQPNDALVNTSVYFAFMNSVSAASCPARMASLSPFAFERE